MGLWNAFNIVELILGTEDTEYIKSCIKDRQYLGLNNYYVKKLIFKTRDVEFLASCIVNRENLGLGHSEVKNLILLTKDIDYFKFCIKNRKSLDLDSNILKNLILLTGDLDYIQTCIANKRHLNLKSNDIYEISQLIEEKLMIHLPEIMTVGIEIESECEYEDYENDEYYETCKEFKEKIARVLELSNKEWECKDDESLSNGIEVVSPVLTNDFKKCSREIRSVCAVLNGFEQNISGRCGGHIHIGADYLTSVDDYKNLINIWSNAEKIVYIISNEKGIIPRNRVMKYAQPISGKIEDSLEDGIIYLDDESALNEFVQELYNIQVSRYSGINFENIGDENKSTIEFRLSNGTLSPNTWIENINLFGGIVKVAHDLSIIQSKPQNHRNKEEKEKLQYFELIKNEGNEGNQEIVLKALLQLCVPENQIQTYIDRYNINKPLMESNSRLNEELNALISKTPIKMV